MTHVPFLPGWQGFVANLAPVMVLAWIVQSVQNARRKGQEVLFPCADTVSIVFTFVRNLFLCAALEFLGVAGVKGDISKITQGWLGSFGQISGRDKWTSLLS